MPRQYNQFCALARALDVVGERWTLLIVRELLLGPRRFNELARALPGIGRNLLAARMRELEAGGLVERRPPGYGLTARGRALEETVLALTRWELDQMRPPQPGDQRRPGWYALAMWAAYRPAAAGGRNESYEFRVDGETFHLRTAAGEPEARHGPAADPAARLETDVDSFRRRALRAFGLPAPVATG